MSPPSSHPRYRAPRSAPRLRRASAGQRWRARVFEVATRLLSPTGVCLVETSDHLLDATLAAAATAGFTADVETDDDIGAVVVVASLST